MGHLREQLLVHAESISLFFSLGVGVFGLVQSQRESGPASASTGQENSDGTWRITVKIGIQFLLGRIGYCNHRDLRRFHSGKCLNGVCQRNIANLVGKNTCAALPLPDKESIARRK